MFRLVALFFLGLSGSAVAEGLPFKIDQIAKGSTVTIRGIDNKLFLHQHLGKAGRGYAFRTFVVEGKNPVLNSTNFTDREGRLVKQEYENGDVYQYRPNRCSRVIGKCQFTRVNPDGSKQPRVLVGSISGDTYIYQISEADGTFVLRGEIKVDEFGWTKSGVVKGADGKVVRLKQVASDYK